MIGYEVVVNFRKISKSWIVKNPVSSHKKSLMEDGIYVK